MTFGIIFVWLTGSVAVAAAAHDRGRNAFGWFVAASLFLSPLLALIFVGVLPDLKRERRLAVRHEELMKALGVTTSDTASVEFADRTPPLQLWSWGSVALLVFAAVAFAAVYTVGR
jgi:hypothetical protein